MCLQAAEPAPEVRARRKIRFKKDSVANQNDAMHRAQVDQIKARFRYRRTAATSHVLIGGSVSEGLALVSCRRWGEVLLIACLCAVLCVGLPRTRARCLC